MVFFIPERYRPFPGPFVKSEGFESTRQKPPPPVRTKFVSLTRASRASFRRPGWFRSRPSRREVDVCSPSREIWFFGSYGFARSFRRFGFARHDDVDRRLWSERSDAGLFVKSSMSLVTGQAQDRFFQDAMTQDKKDRNGPNVKKLLDLIVPPLVKLRGRCSTSARKRPHSAAR